MTIRMERKKKRKRTRLYVLILIVLLSFLRGERKMSKHYDFVLEQLDAPTNALSESYNVLRKQLNDVAQAATNSITIHHGNASKELRERPRLPTLEELTVIRENYECSPGTHVFRNIVLPRSITHVNRKIPQVVHMTAKTRCVTDSLEQHIMKWKFPNHSLYFHDDDAVYALLDYAANDRYGYEIVENFSKAALCISNGATMADMWRYVLLYHYGGIYTDLDNSPGKKFSPDLITPKTDSYYFVEQVGVMSQFWMSSSQHHPLLLHVLQKCVQKLMPQRNVMINNAPKTTGPGALKGGMIMFQNASGVNSNGYLPKGVYSGGIYDGGYVGGLGDAGIPPSKVPWWETMLQQQTDNDDTEYPSASELLNRTVTVMGRKDNTNHFVFRNFSGKEAAWKDLNMTHYQKDRQRFPGNGCISCRQHIQRMEMLVHWNISHYYGMTGIRELIAHYEFKKQGGYYIDLRTMEQLSPSDWE